MTDMHGAGGAIRAARQQAGLTVRGLAHRLGVSAATISGIENDRIGTTVVRLRAIADALDVTPASLLGSDRRGERTPPLDAPSAAHGWRDFPALAIDPVLAGAVDAFVEAGYHGTSMRQLAARLGLSVPGIYHYYPDKQQLLVRILDITMGELHWRIDAAQREARDSLEAVALTVEALALFHTHHRKLAFIGASEMRSFTDANHQRIAESRNQLQHKLDTAIDHAIADGFLATDQARAAGRAIATMCTSLPQWFREGGSSTPEEIARTYVEFALSMLGSRRRHP